MSAKKAKQTVVESTPDLETRRHTFQGVASGKLAFLSPRTFKTSLGSSRMRRMTGVAIIALVVFVPTIALAAYSIWYQGADKTVADAFYNTLSSSSIGFSATVDTPTRQVATLNGRATDGRAALDVSMKTSLPDDLSTMNISAIATNKDFFFKIPNASRMLTANAPQTQMALFNALVPVVQQDVDNNWVYVQSTELPYVQSIISVSTCAMQAAQRLMTNQESRLAFMSLYHDHSFMDAKQLRSRDSETTYQVTIKSRQFTAFLDALMARGNDVPFGRCSDGIKTIRQGKLGDAVLQVTVNRQTRTLTKLTVAIPGSTQMAIAAEVTNDDVEPVSEPPEAEIVRFQTIKNKILMVASGISE